MDGLINFYAEMFLVSLESILGFLVGAMMSIDMGGPINKAAYVAGTALVTSAGQLVQDVIAAVMVETVWYHHLRSPIAATISKTYLQKQNVTVRT